MDMKERGVLQRFPMFSEITATGVKWTDGKEQPADIILWNTGFKSALDHLKPVLPREQEGGILMGGRLATMVVKEPRIHLVGYGPQPQPLAPTGREEQLQESSPVCSVSAEKPKHWSRLTATLQLLLLTLSIEFM